MLEPDLQPHVLRDCHLMLSLEIIKFLLELSIVVVEHFVLLLFLCKARGTLFELAVDLVELC